MVLEQARLLLRQQIAFAKFHVDSVEELGSSARQRAAIQASMLSLNIGLVVYYREITNNPELTTLSDLLSVDASIVKADYRQVELQSLMHDNASWLYILCDAIDSMSRFPPKDDLSLGKPLIASSNPQRHWTRLSLSDIQSMIVCSSEILDRHSAHDEEY